MWAWLTITIFRGTEKKEKVPKRKKRLNTP